MSWLCVRPLRSHIALAAFASALLNLMLLVPALYALWVFERVFTSRSVETLVMLSALVVIALAVAHAMDLLRHRALEAAAGALARTLVPPALARLLERHARPMPAPHAANERDAAGSTDDALRDVNTLRGFLGGAGIVALFDAPWLPVHLAVITLMHPLLGAAAAAGALALIVLGAVTDRLTRGASEAAQHSARNHQRQAQVLLRRADAIAGLGMAGNAVRAYAAAQDEVLERAGAASRRALPLAALARTLRHALQAGVLGFGAWLVVTQDASPGMMVAASLLLGRALQPAVQIIGGWKLVVGARAAWARLQQPGSAPAVGQGLELPAPSGRIDVERVVFGAVSGPQGRLPLLKGVSLALAPGESLGLVGASGSGKSTLARLLLGAWAPQSGTVRLDGADIARWDRERLAPHIGYLPQDVELFPGTVAENIARLASRGPLDAARITAAAALAHAHELILRLPQGYDTPVGDGGAALSGGQRQRVALARALYGSPCLVVLDEPNAHLDAEGDAALEATLAELKARATTVVVVTHKSAVLSRLDKVALLKDGVLEAFGSVATAPAPAPAPRLRAVAAPV